LEEKIEIRSMKFEKWTRNETQSKFNKQMGK